MAEVNESPRTPVEADAPAEATQGLHIEALHAAASDLLHLTHGGECDPRTLREHAGALYAVAERVSQLEATVAELICDCGHSAALHRPGKLGRIVCYGVARDEDGEFCCDCRPNKWFLALTAEHTARLAAEQDALTVAEFIVGYWPGLEDGISWGGNVDDHPAHRAAERILATPRMETPAP